MKQNKRFYWQSTVKMYSNISEDENASTTYEVKMPFIPMVGILVVQSFGTIVGNVLVCIAIYIQPNLHTVTYCSIFSLALADLMAGMIAMPSYIAKKFIEHGPYAKFVCDASRFSYFISGYASILSLSVISVERLVAVKNPLAYVNVVTRKRILMALVLIWVDTLVVSLLPFIPLPGSDSQECNYEPTWWWSVMVIVSNVIVPFLVIVLCYLYIYFIARTHMQRIKSERKSVRVSLTNKRIGAKERKERKERKANVTIMIVIGVFVVCWFPSCIYYFLQKVCPQCFPEDFTASRGIINALVKILTFTSSFCNPIIYCWRSNDFRNAFIKILLRKSRNLSASFRSTSRSSAKGNSSLMKPKPNEDNTKDVNSLKNNNEKSTEI
ncbi:D(2) dopamine receptor A-like isoform X2 [Actinia tenebrosa]|uniref:D(2) dopamine receptor A-like isoform X2 n=1 Tax=Actinia tenebrosa TaxID=6105 RepID=A0A6P8IF54_ACTTE|nr:D(2) dopamine receptor A-like isoform X2 [Actinia tenebrosa]